MSVVKKHGNIREERIDVMSHYTDHDIIVFAALETDGTSTNSDKIWIYYIYMTEDVTD